MRVLVVQDETTGDKTAVEQLTHAGHHVVGCTGQTRDAMRLARIGRPNVALVDLDVQGKADGLELAEQLTADLNIDVIVCSEHEDFARPAPTGAIALLRKPYEPQDIARSIAVVEALRSGKVPLPPIPSSLELLISPQ